MSIKSVSDTKTISVYFWGALYAKLRIADKELEFRRIDSLTGEYIEEWKNVNEGMQEISIATAPYGFFAMDFDKVKSILENYVFEERRFDIKDEILSQYDYRTSDKDYKWLADDCTLYADFTKNSYIVDLIEKESKIIGLIVPAYFETFVITFDEFADITPNAEFRDQKLSQRSRGHKLLGEYYVPMQDGVKLYTRVHVPADYKNGEKIPSIYCATPYLVESGMDINKEFADLGYAVVFQDVRGRGKSEGVFRPFLGDMSDGNDTLKWIEEQEFFDGSIGSWGGSYCGYNQWALAFNGRKSLKCIAPFVTGGGSFDDVLRRGGSFQLKMMGWILNHSGMLGKGNHSFKQPDDFQAIVGEYRPIVDLPKRLSGVESEYIKDVANHPDLDDFWTFSDFREMAKNIKIPCFMMSGPFDGDNAGNMACWNMIQDYDYPGRKIYYGPWVHFINGYRNMADYELSEDAIIYNLEIQYIRFFDHYLKGKDNGIEKEPAVNYYSFGENKWHTDEAFPPVNSIKGNLFLYSKEGKANISMSDGELKNETAQGSSFDSYEYNPNDAAPQLFPVKGKFGAPFLPLDYSNVEKRHDVLTYTSQPFSKRTNLLGKMELEFYASSDAKDTDWAARVCIVKQDGTSMRMTDNILTAKYRNGYKKSEYLKKDKVEKYKIELPMVSHTVEKGEKLRLEFTSAMKYLFAENPNTGENIMTYTRDNVFVANQKIYHSEDYPSKLTYYSTKPE